MAGGYVSWGTRKALGKRYSIDPALEMDRERLQQEYALVPGREARALQREENALSRAEREEAKKAQTTASYIGAAGNVAGLGMQYLNYTNNRDSINKMPNQALTSADGSYDRPYIKGNPAPRTTQVSPYWGEQAAPLGTKQYQGPEEMYTPTTVSYEQQNIPKAALNTGNGLNMNPQSSALVDTGNAALGGAGTALSGYKTYQDIQRGDYLNATLDATKTGIGAYNTANAASKAITGAGVAAGTALGEALPVVGAAIGAGQGVADIAQSKNAKDVVSGTWRVVDGVLQYVVPFYGLGRGASQVVDAGAALLGQGDSPIINNIQDVFDPAGMAAGQRKGNSMYNSVFGKE